ncbi:MAG TPA: hypothetical protein VJ577_20560 [Burkholderiaceae bacterium]|nr:hypothetical protein [Burkholderiaceae bacterium]
MSTCNVHLGLDQVIPGMTLSEPLLDAKGGVLLPPGTMLTEGMLNTLRRRRIETIAVFWEREENPPVDTEIAVERERARQRLRKLFRRCGTEGANGQVLQYVTRYRTGTNA